MATTASTATAATAATTKVAQFWTVFLGVLAGILTALRLTAPAEAVRRAVGTSERPAPIVPLPRHASFAACTALTGSEPRREGSLPPTIKQRIRAEAHGASPVSRQRTAGLGDTSPAPVTDAPAGDLVPADERFERFPCAA
ncbi:DUF6344 domain-containing protein [Streptomyces sp. H39-S7]|uniref:DUF6344 domain-containing protein n=1 Tax=Streptomyces sp. H39-S7 TaxID=3004357 RepID=UPI0022AE6622|nr:DUF6344 domain-containing protein [Streptomyces sp. H39-S7]MCZ4117968.1 DUF6344 domain-containing protein [Streptomyces sp. H39-S7]